MTDHARRAGASLFALCALLLLPARARAEGAPGAEAIDVARLRANIEHLASDALQGRGSGAEGGRLAGDWLAEQCAALGLTPGGTEGWFQPFEAQGQRMRNVIALLPGSEPGEAVVIGAHYDHLGLGHQAGSLDFGRGRGQIHNGADDNASGTAAVLEVARAFLASGAQPRRTVAFVWFDGEERGLLGSAALVEQQPFAGRVTLMINLDMVGRLEDDPLIVFGAPTGDRLQAWLEQANAELGLRLDLRETMTPNSDHASFYRRKVPVLVPFTGLHRDYHRPSDDAARVDVEGVAKVARLTYGVAAQAAGSEHVLAFREVRDGTLEAVLEQLTVMFGDGDFAERLRDMLGGPGGEQGREGLPGVLGRLFGGRRGEAARPRLGLTLEETGGGLLVRSVTAGSVAEAAGFAPGDRIVSFAGEPVTTLAALRAEVAAARGAVDVVVERGAERVTLTARFGGGDPEPAPSPAPTPEGGVPEGPRWF